MNRVLLTLVASGALLAGCATSEPSTSQGGPTGQITQAGSSTVYPIAEAWAEALAPRGIQVAVSGGGSGAGASKLCAKEIDIGDMSRPMKQGEIDGCKANGVDPTQWTVAYDGVTIVVAKTNDFVDHLTVEELKAIWQADSAVRTWADVREGWPAEPIRLYGPDPDSGTYEYFNEEILGKSCGADGKQVCGPRSDYTPSADDNILVEGVRASPNALGYFGFAYYVENTDTLRAVPVVPKGGSAPVAPSFQSIAEGSYKPLGRPIFMYTDGIPEDGTVLHAYFQHAFGEGQAVIQDVGYVPLDPAKLAEMNGRL